MNSYLNMNIRIVPRAIVAFDGAYHTVASRAGVCRGALACSRRSDSRAWRSVGSELNFFLREFFSRALLSERLEQAWGARK